MWCLIAQWYSYAPPRSRNSKYRRTLIPLSVSLWNDHVDSVFDGVGLVGFKSWANAFNWPKLHVPFCHQLFSMSLISFDLLVLWGWGFWTDRGKLLSPSLAFLTSFNNNNLIQIQELNYFYQKNSTYLYCAMTHQNRYQRACVTFLTMIFMMITQWRP